MQHQKAKLLDFIWKKRDFFKIPEFQRPYSWEDEGLTQFFSDLDSVKISKKTHFFGSIVSVNECSHTLVIDGQQRLTTAYIFLCAVYHTLRDRESKGIISTIKSQTIIKEYLYGNYGQTDEQRHIILKTVTTDDNVLSMIIKNPNNLNPNQKVNKQYKAFVFFKDTCLVNRFDLADLVNALNNFELIHIMLENNDDDPQAIFESINTTGKPLDSGDKIRNYALMLKTDELRHYVFDDYWTTIEKKLLFKEKNKEICDISKFFKYFLQCMQTNSIDKDNVYSKFKELYKDLSSLEDFRDFYSKLMQYLEAFIFLTRLECTGTKLDQQTKQYKQLKYLAFRFRYFGSEVHLSFFMDLIVDFFNDLISVDELNKIFKHYESYIVRKMALTGSIGSFNKEICKWHHKIQQLKKEYPDKKESEIFASILLSLGGRIIFPADEIVRKSLSVNPIGTYPLTFNYYILTSIEEMQEDIGHLLQEIVEKRNNLTLEHIMPQKITSEWKNALGQEWQQVHEVYLNNIGNLTLSAYNSQYSNSSFTKKKEAENGFDFSNLNINCLVKKSKIWNEKSINDRRDTMIENFIKCFQFPKTTIKLSSTEKIFTLEELAAQDNCYTKPCSLIIENYEDISVKTWKEALIKILLLCYNKDKDSFIDLADKKAMGGTKNACFGIGVDTATSAKRLVKNENIFYNDTLSANQIIEYLYEICKHFSLEETILVELRK